MKTRFTKLICLVLAVLFLLPLSAIATIVEADEVPVEGVQITDVEGLDELTEEDLFISEDVAYYIALQFLNDGLQFELVECWTADTTITDSVIMYSETGDSITAYTFELSSGYIVVAAHLDAPNLVLEWSDETAPVYDEFELADDAEVVYAGALNYYVDDGGETLITIDGIAIERDEVENVLEETSDINNVPENVLAVLAVESNESIYTESDTISTFGVGDEKITDPFTHANKYYTGPFVSNDYQNKWESYVKFVKTSDISATNHCGPTAIANLVKAYGAKNNKTNITGKSNATVLTTVKDIGTSNGYYAAIGGTSHSNAGNYIKAAFSNYGYSVTVNNYTCNYNNLEITLRNGRLMYITLGTVLNNHGYYGYHAVMAYAYTRLVSSTTGAYKTYLKIADGWSSSGRYLDLATCTNYSYWEVKF